MCGSHALSGEVVDGPLVPELFLVACCMVEEQVGADIL